jgi:hypothetical protein
MNNEYVPEIEGPSSYYNAFCASLGVARLSGMSKSWTHSKTHFMSNHVSGHSISIAFLIAQEEPAVHSTIIKIG